MLKTFNKKLLAQEYLDLNYPLPQRRFFRGIINLNDLRLEGPIYLKEFSQSVTFLLNGNPDLSWVYTSDCLVIRDLQLYLEQKYSSDKEKNKVEALDLRGQALTGSYNFSKFPNLQKLNCSKNRLTGFLDFSSNSNLRELSCSSNKISGLILNSLLTKLHCSSNEIKELKVPKGLKFLSCSSNYLSELDLSLNSELEELFCFKNNLNILKFSKINCLSFLNCLENPLPLSSLLFFPTENLQILVLGYHYEKKLFSRDELMSREFNAAEALALWKKNIIFLIKSEQKYRLALEIILKSNIFPPELIPIISAFLPLEKKIKEFGSEFVYNFKNNEKEIWLTDEINHSPIKFILEARFF